MGTSRKEKMLWELLGDFRAELVLCCTRQGHNSLVSSLIYSWLS